MLGVRYAALVEIEERHHRQDAKADRYDQQPPTDKSIRERDGAVGQNDHHLCWPDAVCGPRPDHDVAQSHSRRGGGQERGLRRGRHVAGLYARAGVAQPSAGLCPGRAFADSPAAARWIHHLWGAAAALGLTLFHIHLAIGASRVGVSADQFDILATKAEVILARIEFGLVIQVAFLAALVLDVLYLYRLRGRSAAKPSAGLDPGGERL